MTEAGRLPGGPLRPQLRTSTPPTRSASYRALREKAPVAWSEAHGGYWVLSGYKAVFEAARDDEIFSSERNSYGGEGLSVVIPKTPAHVPHPDRDRPAQLPQVAQAHQPDHRAGGHRPDGADGQALRHLVHRRDHRDRRGRHDVGHRRPGHRHRRLARPAVKDWERYASALPRAARRRTGHASSTTARSRSTCRTSSEITREVIARAAGEPDRTTSSATWCSSRSTTARSPTTRCSRWSTCCSPAASARRRRWSATPWCGSTSTPTFDSTHRRPVVAGQGDRGVPALLLPHPGAGPHRRPRTPSSSAAR